MCVYLWYTNTRRDGTDRITKIEGLLRNIPSASGDDGRCLLQKYDLYDPSVLQFIAEEPYKLDCSRRQPYFTYLDWEGNLHLNRTEFDKEAYSSVQCWYETVIRRSDDESKVDYDQPVAILHSSIKINVSAVRVTCKRFGLKVYVTVHAWIVNPTKNRISKNKQLDPHKPSVLMLVIDSMSRGQFIRALPKTYSLLVDKGIVVLEGLNKVGDNTYRNMLPLLTGMRYDEDMRHVPNIPQRKYLPNEKYVVKFDDDPIIWRQFQEQGYFTMYSEEYLTPTFDFGDYVREFEGFIDEPVDYYFRPYYVALLESSWSLFTALNFRRRYCIGNEPSYKYLLNYTEEFVRKMKGLRYFALPFFVEHSHEYFNDIKNMDNDLHTTLSSIFNQGLLDNTILIVMGDHGHRFSGIRSTPIGRLEERMPFFGMIIPEQLQKLHPNIKEGLIINKDVLLSWFDIYSTLLDILQSDFRPVSVRNRLEYEIGSSVFRPVATNRTCIQIGIPQVYCTCGLEKIISMESPVVKNAAEALVKHLNKLLSIEDDKTYIANDSRRCAVLNLSEIHSASLMASWQDFDNRDTAVNIRVMLTTIPGRGKFEGALEFKGENEDITVIGDVNRVNKYDDQSECIRSTILKLYCYCV